MRTTETRSGAASGTAGVREVDVRLEVVGSRFSDVDPAAGAPAGSLLAPLRSATGVALIAGTVLASGVASYDASVVTVAVPAIGRRFDAPSRRSSGRSRAICWRWQRCCSSPARSPTASGAVAC